MLKDNKSSQINKLSYCCILSPHVFQNSKYLNIQDFIKLNTKLTIYYTEIYMSLCVYICLMMSVIKQFPFIYQDLNFYCIHSTIFKFLIQKPIEISFVFGILSWHLWKIKAPLSKVGKDYIESLSNFLLYILFSANKWVNYSVKYGSFIIFILWRNKA